MPADIKFKDGTMKQVLKNAMRPVLPDIIVDRKDKMGFPTPLTEWLKGEAHEFVQDVFSAPRAQTRALVNNKLVLDGLQREPKFGRKAWGLLCLELWQQEFHDRESEFKNAVIGDK
jgi:asparagine synthase (glutamine-hydrolysing)